MVGSKSPLESLEVMVIEIQVYTLHTLYFIYYQTL